MSKAAYAHERWQDACDALEAKQEALAPQPENLAQCPRCCETLRFVEGLTGPQRWVHVRTGDWQCDPRCKHCGKPGIVKIGRWDMDGGLMPIFRYSHHECADCCKQTFRVEHT